MNNPLVNNKNDESLFVSSVVAMRQQVRDNDDDPNRGGGRGRGRGGESPVAHDGYMLELENCDSTCLPENSVIPSEDPDDDQSMNYVFEYLKYYQEDMFWSFLSDVCFLTGSVLYLLLSYYQLEESKPFFIHVLAVMAPLLYLQNSVVDIQWALQVQKRQKIRTEMSGLWQESTGLRPPLTPSFSSGAGMNNNNNAAQPPTWWQRLGKYAAHRRTLYAAGSFGLAALLSVIAVLLEQGHNETSNNKENNNNNNNNEWAADTLYTISDHVYVVSAVIAMTGRRIRPWFYSSTGNRCTWAILNEPEALEDMGDFLFLIGSLFDATLDNLSMKTIPSLGAVSSFLWFVDALLYLQSDFVMSRRLKNSELSTHIV